MRIVILNAAKVKPAIDFSVFNDLGGITIYEYTKEKEILDRIKNTEVIVTTIDTPINKDIIYASPSLKLIAIMATAHNSVDIHAAKSKEIGVAVVAGYSTKSVAQHTFAMILHVYNSVYFFDNYIKQGLWKVNADFSSYQKLYNGLNNKNYGIIGLGAIGMEVAKIAQVFGCNVSYYSTSGNNNSTLHKKSSLDELLQESDIISIHAPLNENTKNLIDFEKLKLMKSNAILLNLSRGGIINEADLAKAIDEDIIGAACLDVFTTEPLHSDSPLYKIKNKHKLIMTPHIGWASNESRQKLVDEVAENIKAYKKGERRNRIV